MNMVFLSNYARIQTSEVLLKQFIISANTVRHLLFICINGTSKMVCFMNAYDCAVPYSLPGRFTALLEPQPEFLPLVGAFFTTSHYPRLEWIHDLAKPVSKFESAVTALETICHTEAGVDTKKVSSGI